MGATNKGAILVVDDDPDIRHTLQVILERNGYTVKTARDGAQGLRTLEEYQPDLIIMDLMMNTDTEGYDTACAIRDNPRFAHLPIIMLTCFLEKVRQEGPDNFQKLLGEEWPANWLFEKPVDPAKLLAKIERIMKRA